MSGFHDEYRDALEKVIEAKAAGRKPPKAAGQAKAGGQVMDLMAALEESVRKTREARGEDATVHDMPKTKAPAKKTAKKAEGKKAAKKKTTSRKRSA